jgi:hypothetical protein
MDRSVPKSRRGVSFAPLESGDSLEGLGIDPANPSFQAHGSVLNNRQKNNSDSWRTTAAVLGL